MRILFLVPRLDKASTRYRVLQYLPFLEAAGSTCTVRPLSRAPRQWGMLLREVRRADVVVVQKKLFSRFEILLLRRLARRLVYDFDDAVMYKDAAASDRQQRRQRRRFEITVARADLVIAGNRYLRQEALTANPRVELLPTPLDLERYRLRPPMADNGVVLGWIGSRGTLKYLQQLTPVLEEVGRRFPGVRLKIVADAFFDLRALPVEKKPWSEAEEIADLHSFDIGLMPLADDVWTRGKCGFKLLQCMAVGLPVVCSPVGINAEIVSDGVEGFWATDQTEWVQRLGELIADAGLRAAMGERARRKVESGYSLAVAAPLLLHYLQEA